MSALGQWIKRGEAKIAAGMFDEAQHDFQHVIHQIDGNNRAAHDGIQKAQFEAKKAKRKDYYKILGVEPDASAQVIKKQFRKLALLYHP